MLNRLDKTRLAAYYQVSVLALAASVIYSAPYLRQLFKTSMLDAFSLTEVQLGTLSSMYGISCVLCYLPGGWLADKVAPRILVIIALFSSAATYAWYATIPSYLELLIIHALWGVIGVGILWALLYVCPIPVRTLGTAIGFISIVGYSGDIYIPLVSAWLQTNHPTGTAYQFFFAYVATVTAIGLIATWLLGKTSRPSLVE